MITKQYLYIIHTLQILTYHNVQQLKTTLISGLAPPILIHLTLHSLMPAFTINLAEMIQRTALSSLSQRLNNETWLGVSVTRSFSFWMEHLVSIVPAYFFSSVWLSTMRTRVIWVFQRCVHSTWCQLLSHTIQKWNWHCWELWYMGRDRIHRPDVWGRRWGMFCRRG